MSAPIARLSNRARAFLVIFVYAVSSPPGVAERAELAIAQITGSGWQASNIRLVLTLDGEQPALTAHVGVLQLDMLATTIEGAELECPLLRLTTSGGHCGDLRLRVDLPTLGLQRARGAGRYSWAQDQLQIDMGGFNVADGQVMMRARLGADGWQVTANSDELAVAGLLALLAAPSTESESPPTGEGAVKLNLAARGAGRELASLTIHAEATDATLSNASGTLATADLGAELSLTAEPMSPGWGGSLNVTRTAGQLYLEPIFLNLTDRPVTAKARWQWREEGKVQLSQLTYTQPGVVEAVGNLSLSLTPSVVPLRAELALTGDGGAYALYLRPWWFGTPAETLTMSGPVNGRVELVDGTLQRIQLVPTGLNIADTAGRVEAAGLAGQVSWSADGAAEQSQLRWQAAQVYGLPIAAGMAGFVAQGNSLELPDGLTLDTLGGQLIIDELAMSGLGTETPDARFAARIMAIDLSQLTAALKWPSFQGTLSGVLPRLTYRSGEVVVGGTLRAQAFDGDFTLSNLRVTGPFGDIPQLFGDLSASQVDLEQLTRTVSFGRITGRADLQLTGLHLLAWSPVSFAARLATTPGDTSRHRISQQAIDNIAAVSGGPAGMLSTGFMGMFKDFGYAELGLRCRLENGVCHMGGVGPARDGYYIVRGKGLPRIDVVGFKTEVDWGRLVRQLQAILKSQSAVVE